jgi:hypothetical protein
LRQGQEFRVTTFFATGDDAQRVADYRKRADEMFTQAEAASDEVVRATLIDIANSYLKLAQRVESQAMTHALKAAPTAKPKSGRDHKSGRSDS